MTGPVHSNRRPVIILQGDWQKLGQSRPKIRTSQNASSSIFCSAHGLGDQRVPDNTSPLHQSHHDGRRTNRMQLENATAICRRSRVPNIFPQLHRPHSIRLANKKTPDVIRTRQPDRHLDPISLATDGAPPKHPICGRAWRIDCQQVCSKKRALPLAQLTPHHEHPPVRRQVSQGYRFNLPSARRHRHGQRRSSGPSALYPRRAIWIRPRTVSTSRPSSRASSVGRASGLAFKARSTMIRARGLIEIGICSSIVSNRFVTP